MVVVVVEEVDVVDIEIVSSNLNCRSIGNVTLSLVSVTDDVLGPISFGGTLAPSESFEITRTGTFALGQQHNIATVTGAFDGVQVSSSDSAFYTGVIA